jgi:hypothetical protein
VKVHWQIVKRLWKRRATISALQAESEQRIGRYQRLKDEAKESGNEPLARKWNREVVDEKKTLAVIKRVERINASGTLEDLDNALRPRVRQHALTIH